MNLEIAADDPRRPDVRELLQVHLAFSREVTPPGYAHALEVEDLVGPTVTFVSARRDGIVLGVGALKSLDARHAELKSMHTRAAARGQGVGRAIVEHLLSTARTEGITRVSLETGTMDAFAPARALYASMGFGPCDPFDGYSASSYNTFMTLALVDHESTANITDIPT